MIDTHLRLARTLTHVLDNNFSLFGVRFGLDSILGLIPGLGDIVGLLFSCYLIWIGHIMQIPNRKKIEMVKNVAFDFLIGSVPVVGDIADVFYKANVKNLRILEEFHSTDTVIEGEIIT